MSDQKDEPLRIFLLDSPRTCSHLFRRIFQHHPQLEQMMHLYASPSMYGPERVFLKLKHCEAAEEANQAWVDAMPERASETFDSTTKTFIADVEAIEKRGKLPFIKEHVCNVVKTDIAVEALRTDVYEKPTSNPTYIPDDFLASTSPVFLIRHPAQILPSSYRVMHSMAKLDVNDEDFALLSSQRWSRMLWDYFASQPPARPPILLDAEDVLQNAEIIVPKICKHLGILTEGVEYKWDPVPKENWPDDPLGITRAFLGDLLASKGIARSEKARTIDLETEMEKWTKNFGLDVAKVLRERVNAEMADYEYLKQFKLSV